MKKSVQNRKSVAGQRQKEKREMKIVKSAPIAKAVQQNFAGGSRSGRQSWRFPGRELVGDVAGSVAFATTRYILNPGISQSFPWLSGEADKWEQYRFHRLRFVYVPRCASTTVGSILLSPDYNVRDLAPSTELEAADTFGAVENSVWTELACSLDVSAMYPIGPRKMIRQAVVPGDMNLYDCGSFYVSTVGNADATVIGKLWVEYDIEFYVPQNSPADQLGPSIGQMYTRALSQAFTTATIAAIDWDTPAYNPLQIAEAAGVLTPRAGCYHLSCSVSGNDTTAEAFTVRLSIRKNGVEQIFSLENQSTGGSVGASTEFVLSMNGSDTMDVALTLTGAAGTLSSIALTPVLVVRPI
jgi:hypothetical protein